MGGEEYHLYRAREPRGGLPPRGRGRVPSLSSSGAQGRITPAWAGKSRAAREGRFYPKDYPRVGGEEYQRVGTEGKRAKLPPRGRGRVLMMDLVFLSVWITPAWAGKSVAGSPVDGGRQDYPRVGGEECAWRRDRRRRRGLPPRGRGRALEEVGFGCIPRITPAWAGKRSLQSSGGTARGDYPRVGGEERS